MCVRVDRCTSNHNIRYTLPEVRYQMPWEIREDSYFQLGSNFMEDFMEEGASDPGRQNMQDGGSVPKKRGFQPSRPNGAAFFPPVPSFSLLSLWFSKLLSPSSSSPSSSSSFPSPLDYLVIIDGLTISENQRETQNMNLEASLQLFCQTPHLELK